MTPIDDCDTVRLKNSALACVQPPLELQRVTTVNTSCFRTFQIQNPDSRIRNHGRTLWAHPMSRAFLSYARAASSFTWCVPR